MCKVSNLAPDGNIVNIFINSVLFVSDHEIYGVCGDTFTTQSPSVTASQVVNISVLVRNIDAYPKVDDTLKTV